MTAVAVYLVDDHAIVRQGVKVLLEAEPDIRVAGESDDATDLVERVAAAGADLVVMDVSIPGIGGVRATAELKRLLPKVKVVALTRHTERAYLQQMMRSGASGYILKQNGAATLVAAIRAVVRGGTYLDPAIAGKLIEPATHPSARGRAAQSLSSREQQIATLVALGHSNKEIANELGIAVKTVEAHKANLMQKLELTSRSELVQFAIDQGWLEPSASS